MRLVFTSLFCFLSITLFGQYQQRSATLTDREGSVFSGTLRFYDWDRSPTFIEFSADSSALVNQIPVRSIQELVINNGPIYEGLYTKLPYYTTVPIVVGGNPVDHIDSTYYLAELLLDSEPVKLYRFFDQNANVRFIIDKYDTLTVLTDLHIKIQKRDALFTFEDHIYRRQLHSLLQECPTLITETVLYTEASLITLLKEYLSFCRIDSKIYLEQKKFGKPIVGLGGFGASWQSAEGNARGYGLSVQMLLPRLLHNTFVLFDIGKFDRNSTLGQETALQLGLYAGRYFGRHAIQGKLYTGFSTVFGMLDTGVGISYRKIVAIETRYPVFTGVVSGFKETGYSTYLHPSFTVRAVFPLTSSARKQTSHQ
jgi:hypothetical protein